MRRISLASYHKSMGELIDLSSPQDFKISHHPDAKNIPYQKFMLYYDQLLSKKKPYFFVCEKGLHSGKVVRMLEYFGYDVTQVLK